MTVSAAWSAAVTGSKLPPVRLLSDTDSAVRKNGRMVSPETEASSFRKAEKSIAVIQAPIQPGPGCAPAARTYRRVACGATAFPACRSIGAVRPEGPGLPKAGPKGRGSHDYWTPGGRAVQGCSCQRCRARRNADLDLCHQPIAAQFDRRHRARPRGRTCALAAGARTIVERVLFHLRDRANSGR